MLDGGLSLLGVGGWELRDDLDVDLVVSLGILRAARREGGKDSREARKRAEQRNSSDRLEQSSIRLEPKSPTNKLDSAKTFITWSKTNRETSRKRRKLSSLEAKRVREQAEEVLSSEKQAGQHKLSSLGQGPTMSPGSRERSVI